MILAASETCRCIKALVVVEPKGLELDGLHDTQGEESKIPDSRPASD